MNWRYLKPTVCKNIITATRIGTYKHLFNDKQPTKFPTVDSQGDVWISDKAYLYSLSGYHSEPLEMIASPKEAKIFWRYRKAWQLMNR